MSDYMKDMFIEVRKETKDTAVGANLLMEMIGETLDVVYEEFVQNEPEVLSEMSMDKAKEFMLVLPKFVPTEAWGDPNSMQREQINRLFSVMGGGRTIEGKLQFLQRITVPDNKISSPRRIISSLIILESLKAVIHSFNAASAGFVFEGWLSALLQGAQEAEISAKGNLPIQDLIAFEQSDNPIPISLKLLNQTTNIEGSYTNLIDGLDEFDRMVYIVARKSKDESGSEEGIAIEQFTFTKDNFIDALSLSARGGKTKGADLFRLPGFTTEQSITILKGGTVSLNGEAEALPDESWETKYKVLQATAGYSERIRKKRAAEIAKQEAAAAAQDPATDTDLEGQPLDSEPTLNEMIIEEWDMLLESKGGTQWHISPAQLKSYDFVDYKTLGSLPVSEKSILGVARMYMDRLNNELLELFTATKSLSENINKYFTADRRDGAIGSGEKAIKNSTQIQKAMTAQIASSSDSDEIDN